MASDLRAALDSCRLLLRSAENASPDLILQQRASIVDRCLQVDLVALYQSEPTMVNAAFDVIIFWGLRDYLLPAIAETLVVRVAHSAIHKQSVLLCADDIDTNKFVRLSTFAVRLASVVHNSDSSFRSRALRVILPELCVALMQCAFLPQLAALTSDMETLNFDGNQLQLRCASTLNELLDAIHISESFEALSLLMSVKANPSWLRPVCQYQLARLCLNSPSVSSLFRAMLNSPVPDKVDPDLQAANQEKYRRTVRHLAPVLCSAPPPPSVLSMTRASIDAAIEPVSHMNNIVSQAAEIIWSLPLYFTPDAQFPSSSGSVSSLWSGLTIQQFISIAHAATAILECALHRTNEVIESTRTLIIKLLWNNLEFDPTSCDAIQRFLCVCHGVNISNTPPFSKLDSLICSALPSVLTWYIKTAQQPAQAFGAVRAALCRVLIDWHVRSTSDFSLGWLAFLKISPLTSDELNLVLHDILLPNVDGSNSFLGPLFASLFQHTLTASIETAENYTFHLTILSAIFEQQGQRLGFVQSLTQTPSIFASIETFMCALVSSEYSKSRNSVSVFALKTLSTLSQLVSDRLNQYLENAPLMISSLEAIGSRDDSEIRSLALELAASLRTIQSNQTFKSPEASTPEVESAVILALRDTQDELVPVRAHGIRLLGSLLVSDPGNATFMETPLRERDCREARKQVAMIFSVFARCLHDSDDFVVKAVLKVLSDCAAYPAGHTKSREGTELTRFVRWPRRVFSLLVAKFAVDSISPEIRCRIANTLLKSFALLPIESSEFPSCAQQVVSCVIESLGSKTIQSNAALLSAVLSLIIALLGQCPGELFRVEELSLSAPRLILVLTNLLQSWTSFDADLLMLWWSIWAALPTHIIAIINFDDQLPSSHWSFALSAAVQENARKCLSKPSSVRELLQSAMQAWIEFDQHYKSSM